MTDQAAKLRAALSDVEYMLLEMGLQADAGWIANLARENRQAEISAYMAESKYLERMESWKQARR